MKKRNTLFILVELTLLLMYFSFSYYLIVVFFILFIYLCNREKIL